VFAMRITSDFENKILLQKSKRAHQVKEFLSNSTNEEKVDFFKCLFDQQLFMHYYLIEANRFTILLDTNVIQDVLSSKENRQREVRNIATKALLCFLEDYAHANIWLCVTPAVLYELNGQEPISKLSDYRKVLGVTEEVAIELGISTYNVGFHSFKDLCRQTKLLHSDSKNIKAALSKINKKSWKMNFEHEEGRINIPMAVAEHNIPNIKLRYLDPFYVKWVLMNVIEKKMFEQNKHQKKARKLMNNNHEGISKLFKIKKGALMGLADIDLLSRANLTSQTASNSPVITSAITYDRALFSALFDRLGSIRDGGKFEFGKDNAHDGASLMAHQFSLSGARSEFLNARSKVYFEAFKEFTDNTLKFKKDENEKAS
jgi:hypothetical protein